MKLQRHLAYKYKDKDYYKNVIVLPEETISKLGWGAGLELQESTDGNALVLRPLDSPKQRARQEKSARRTK
jgi:hypothetical protein